MVSLNKVFLLGNLTADPAVRATQSGMSVCELRLAVNRTYVSNGNRVEEPCFVDVTVWGRSGEACQRYLSKGSPVLVEGRLHFDQWEDRQTGRKASKLRVVAEQVQFLSTSRRDGSAAPDNNDGGQGGYSGGGNFGGNSYGGNSYGGNQNNGYRNAPNQQRQGSYNDAPRNSAPPVPPMPEDPYVAGAEDDIPF